jgi:hypothetical protein
MKRHPQQKDNEMNGEGVGKAHDPYTVYTTKPLELDKG